MYPCGVLTSHARDNRALLKIDQTNHDIHSGYVTEFALEHAVPQQEEHPQLSNSKLTRYTPRIAPTSHEPKQSGGGGFDGGSGGGGRRAF